MTLISRLIFFSQKKMPQESSAQVKTTGISIVIPVKDNQKGINNYLECFFETHSPDNYPRELIIVDNNSSPPITVPQRFQRKELPVILLRCNRKGPAAARNTGALHAGGDWLLFNDSDCIPTPALLSGYVSASNGSIAYAGNIKAYGNDLLSKYYESQEILLPLKTYTGQYDFAPQYLITANTLVWRPAFITAGGFNEKFVIAGGEDVDLGLRLFLQGRLSYAFDSIALHDFNDGFAGFMKRFIRYGRGNKMVEQVWGTSMRPRLFRPNVPCFFNSITAKFQFVFLLAGYYSAFRPGLIKKKN